MCSCLHNLHAALDAIVRARCRIQLRRPYARPPRNKPHLAPPIARLLEIGPQVASIVGCRTAPHFEICIASGSMKVNVIFVLFLLLLGCSSQPARDTATPTIGDGYSAARDRLIASGWVPVPAFCSRTNVCFDEKYPELASDMKTLNVCPFFHKSSSKLTGCLDTIPDGAKVESFSIER